MIKPKIFVALITAFLFSPLNGWAQNAPVEKTGQTTCYDPSGATTNIIPCAGTGQDGEYQKGVAWPVLRFTDNFNGTVTDNLTGLMWTQDANLFGPGVVADALIACNDLNLGAPILGAPWEGCTLTDWRLPNIKELMSLIDYGQKSPAVPIGHPFMNLQSALYWSSTTSELYPDYAWAGNRNSGNTSVYLKGNQGLYVWCVRGGN